jgi:DNA-binding XRE family transcriptional regulator
VSLAHSYFSIEDRFIITKYDDYLIIFEDPCQLGLEFGSPNHARSSMMQPAQIRAARALLGWSQGDLSKASNVGTATVYRLEKAKSTATGYVSTVTRIQAAFEVAGVLFIDDDGSAGIGVRLAKSKKKRNR